MLYFAHWSQWSLLTYPLVVSFSSYMSCFSCLSSLICSRSISRSTSFSSSSVYFSWSWSSSSIFLSYSSILVCVIEMAFSTSVLFFWDSNLTISFSFWILSFFSFSIFSRVVSCVLKPFSVLLRFSLIDCSSLVSFSFSFLSSCLSCSSFFLSSS